MALLLDDKIQDKSGAALIEDDSDASVIEVNTTAQVCSHGSDLETKKTGTDPKGKMSVTKAYRIEEPLADTKPQRRNTNAAIEGLTAVTSYFNPGAVQDRDANRMSNALQLQQFTAYKDEIRELRSQVRDLDARVHAETRRADKAETELNIFRTIQGQTRHHRHHRRRHYKSSSPSEDSEEVHRRKSRRKSRHYRSRHRSHSRRSASRHHSHSPLHYESAHQSQPGLSREISIFERSPSRSSQYVSPVRNATATSSRVTLDGKPFSVTVSPTRTRTGDLAFKFSTPVNQEQM